MSYSNQKILGAYTDTKQKGGYVYALIDESQRRKLGLGKDVDKRVKQLQTGNAERIKIEHRLYVEDMRLAERSLHSLFAADRLRIDGEWFRLSDKELLLLKKIFRAVDTTNREERLLTSLGFR